MTPIRVDRITASDPPEDYQGLTWTDGRAKPYTAWIGGTIYAIGATKGDAREGLRGHLERLNALTRASTL